MAQENAEISQHLHTVDRLLNKQLAAAEHRAESAEEKLRLVANEFKTVDAQLTEEKDKNTQLLAERNRLKRELALIKKKSLTKARGIATTAAVIK